MRVNSRPEVDRTWIKYIGIYSCLFKDHILSTPRWDGCKLTLLDVYVV